MWNLDAASASSITETNPEMEKIVSAMIEDPLVAVAAYLRQQEEGIESRIRCKAHG